MKIRPDCSHLTCRSNCQLICRVFLLFHAVKQTKSTKFAIYLALQLWIHGLVGFVLQGTSIISSRRSISFVLFWFWYNNDVKYCIWCMCLFPLVQFNGVHLSVVIPSASDDAVNLIAVSTNRWWLKLFDLDLLNMKLLDFIGLNAPLFIYLLLIFSVTLFMGSVQETNSYGSPPTSLLPSNPIVFN